MRRSSRALLAVVCLISGSMWLLPEIDTTAASELCTFAMSTAVATLLVGIVYVGQHGFTYSRHLWNWRLVLSGVGSLSAPTLLFLLGRQQSSGVMATATQASAPLLVAFVTGLTAEGIGARQRLGPGMIALAGVLLVFPVALPASPQEWLGFAFYLAATSSSAVSSVFCHHQMIHAPKNSSFLAVAAANTLFLVTSALMWTAVSSDWHSVAAAFSEASLVPIAMRALSLAGVIYLLSVMSPLAIASRFVLTPLIAATEAYVLMRPTLSLRDVTGAILMLVGCLACVQDNAEQNPFVRMSLR